MQLKEARNVPRDGSKSSRSNGLPVAGGVENERINRKDLAVKLTIWGFSEHSLGEGSVSLRPLELNPDVSEILIVASLSGGTSPPVLTDTLTAFLNGTESITLFN
ncbi:hypothetical protein CDAR_465431 [Caerostris darwini]|uniref:Uncharacterized protein n=1 Tax=Caerostris darwini TaxID=1538125 RepID=A0AAV4S895_9ARAC|nr:hypothetical protein CDAR_465431 [Caerostris darwini]